MPSVSADKLIVMGCTSDFMPHVGEVPDKPGQYIIAGFNGHGMPQILLSAEGVSAMVSNGLPFERTGVPKTFKTTRERIILEDSPLEESQKPLWDGKERAKF